MPLLKRLQWRSKTLGALALCGFLIGWHLGTGWADENSTVLLAQSSSSVTVGNGEQHFHRLTPLGQGFYNVRAPFKVLLGLIDAGTHMSLCELPNGNFLVVDTVKLDRQLKNEIDQLTDGGRRIEAVVATHPFHTLAFQSFYQQYPNPKYYGTPRHLRLYPEIPWAGDVSMAHVRRLWEPTVTMRIPAGSEFVDPKPETTNHFSNVFVFHRPSRTIHNDDTVLFAHKPGLLLSLIGFRDGTMMFHPSMTGPGLLPTPEAPLQFQRWLEALIEDWDFDTLCSAHTGCKVGGAKALLRQTLDNAVPRLEALAEKNAKPQA